MREDYRSIRTELEKASTALNSLAGRIIDEKENVAIEFRDNPFATMAIRNLEDADVRIATLCKVAQIHRILTPKVLEHIGHRNRLAKLFSFPREPETSYRSCVLFESKASSERFSIRRDKQEARFKLGLVVATANKKGKELEREIRTREYDDGNRWLFEVRGERPLVELYLNPIVEDLIQVMRIPKMHEYVQKRYLEPAPR